MAPAGPRATGASLSASALNRFNPVRMMVGGRLDLKPGDNCATFVSSTNNVTVRAGRAQRRRGVPDQRRHLGRHHGGRGRRHLDHRPWQAGLRFQHGIGVRRRPDWRAGPEQRHDQPAAGHAGNGAGAGYINIGACAGTSTGAATTLAAEGTLLVATDRAFTLADNARYGARNLLLAMSTLNLGDEAALARAAAAGAAERADAEPARARQAAQGQCRPRHSRRRNPDPERARFGQCVWLGDAGRHAGVGAWAGWCWARRPSTAMAARPTPRDDPLARTGVDRRVRASLPSRASTIRRYRERPSRTGSATAGCDWPPSASCSATAGHPARELAVGRTPGAGLRRRRPAGQRARDRQWPGHAQAYHRQGAYQAGRAMPTAAAT